MVPNLAEPGHQVHICLSEQDPDLRGPSETLGGKIRSAGTC